MSYLHFGNSWSLTENEVIHGPDNNTIEKSISSLNKDTLFFSLVMDKYNRMYLIQIDDGFQVKVESKLTSYTSSSNRLPKKDVIALLKSYNEKNMQWKTMIRWKNTTILYWLYVFCHFFLPITISPFILLLSIYLKRTLPSPYSSIAYWSCLFLFIIAFISGIILSVLGSLVFHDRFKQLNP